MEILSGVRPRSSLPDIGITTFTTPPEGAKYCDKYISLSAQISHQIFSRMFPLVVTRSSNGVAIRCVLPVLWMASCFHIMARYVYACNSTTVPPRPKISTEH